MKVIRTARARKRPPSAPYTKTAPLDRVPFLVPDTLQSLQTLHSSPLGREPRSSFLSRPPPLARPAVSRAPHTCGCVQREGPRADQHVHRGERAQRAGGVRARAPRQALRGVLRRAGRARPRARPRGRQRGRHGPRRQPDARRARRPHGCAPRASASPPAQAALKHSSTSTASRRSRAAGRDPFSESAYCMRS